MEVILYSGKDFGVSPENFNNPVIRPSGGTNKLRQSLCHVCQASARVRSSKEEDTPGAIEDPL
jgi:hypothetical protein